MLRAVAVLLALAPWASARELPPIDAADWPSLREHARGLLGNLTKAGASLPEKTAKSAQALLEQKSPENPRLAAQALQKLLDAQCLIGININPESRVKATRGPLAAVLERGRTAHVLVRVHNEGGVTHPLKAASEQAVERGGRDAARWLELSVLNDKPFANRLSGQRVEYRVLKLTARQSGKREATLSFDVGQGTQDLGFRSEVPILFTVREP
ncbi:MAG: hypothetical protein U0797_06465 [Gemmataceae bacterium]